MLLVIAAGMWLGGFLIGYGAHSKRVAPTLRDHAEISKILRAWFKERGEPYPGDA